MLNYLKPLSALSSLVFLLCLSASVIAADSRTTIVKRAVDEVLSVFSDTSLSPDERRVALRKKINKVVKENFEFRTISKSVLATNWRKATGHEQDRFDDYFTQTLENTYLTAIESYNGEEVKYVGEKNRTDRAVVDTIIVGKNNDTPISYKLKQTSGHWFVYDVVIENVSMVSNYRNMYAAIVQSSGVDGLLFKLQSGLKKTTTVSPKTPK
ncbi:MAG: ABC transporter substrate-binding protein [Methyloprofundus sp.]|nr:ABC transporter substrate-binding protein [Methyloprofundus sp.]